MRVALLFLAYKDDKYLLWKTQQNLMLDTPDTRRPSFSWEVDSS